MPLMEHRILIAKRSVYVSMAFLFYENQYPQINNGATAIFYIDEIENM
jgi:hypothetical protein